MKRVQVNLKRIYNSWGLKPRCIFWASTAFILAEWLVYLFWGRRLVEMMFEGNAPVAFLNNWLHPSADDTVVEYLQLSNHVFIILNFYLLLCLGLFLRIVNDLKQWLSFSYLSKHCSWLTMGMVLLVLFFGVYFYGGSQLAETDAVKHYDLLFETDPPRIVDDMTNLKADHYRSNVHPIFALMTSPLGFPLGKIIKSRKLAALLINSFAGSIAVLLAFVVFILLFEDEWLAFSASLAFGMTTAQVFYGMVPETGAFAAVSIILSFLIFLVCRRKRACYLFYWLVVGVISLGVTVTNFGVTLLLYGALYYELSGQQLDFKKFVPHLLKYSFLVVVTVGFFSLMQSFLFPSVQYFFAPKSIAKETQHVTLQLFSRPVNTVSEIVKHVGLVGVVAPQPDSLVITKSTITRKGLRALTFSRSWNFSWAWTVVALWIGMLVWGSRSVWKPGSEYRSLFVCCGLWILFNLLLHSVYGMNELGLLEPFVYACNYTFPVFLIGTSIAFYHRKLSAILFYVLAALLAINNLGVMRWIYLTY